VDVVIVAAVVQRALTVAPSSLRAFVVATARS